MRLIKTILATAVLFLSFILNPLACKAQIKTGFLPIDFFGDTVMVEVNPAFTRDLPASLSDSSVRLFYSVANNANFDALVNPLLVYKKQNRLDDWLYYQLIRNTAEAIAPKSKNYQLYTLYKWFLLVKSGYAASVSINNERVLLYVQSDEDVFNIPVHVQNGKQYVCLNYHDYGSIDFAKNVFSTVSIHIPEAVNQFSYKVNSLPDFKLQNYQPKELQFDYCQTGYHFKVMLNRQVKSIFKNYPVVDYETYFNIPLSNITYRSLIPLLRQNVKGMSQKNGIDYLMRFTRYAFAYETDTENFGGEKRLSPEQTLMYDHSDCEDRAALFFYLVKELYNLPMIVLSYPEHITIAVEFDKPMSHPINYKGNNYWVCEPTPQLKDLRIGQSLPALRTLAYEVVYAYTPSH